MLRTPYHICAYGRTYLDAPRRIAVERTSETAAERIDQWGLRVDARAIATFDTASTYPNGGVVKWEALARVSSGKAHDS